LFQEETILKQWHWMDPVDEEEMARNDYIESIQNNRNPFIDSMNFACYIDFTTMNKETNASPCLTNSISLEEQSSLLELIAFPNPTQNILNLQYELKNAEKMTISIFNSVGQKIKSMEVKGLERGFESIDVSNLSEGIYQVKVTGSTFESQLKFIKQ